MGSKEVDGETVKQVRAERDAALNRVALLDAAVTSTEMSLNTVEQALGRAHALCEEQRVAIAAYQAKLEQTEADCTQLRMQFSELNRSRDRTASEAAHQLQAGYLLAERNVQLAEALASADRVHAAAVEVARASVHSFDVTRRFRTLRGSAMEMCLLRLKRAWHRLTTGRVTNR